VHDRGVVVSAVAVLQAERGRRIGSMLTAAAIAVHPELPTTLSATPLGLPVYRRLGFHELSAPVHWQPPA
jgi:GNAT superfamily N-acetyltransferase